MRTESKERRTYRVREFDVTVATVTLNDMGYDVCALFEAMEEGDERVSLWMLDQRALCESDLEHTRNMKQRCSLGEQIERLMLEQSRGTVKLADLNSETGNL